MDSYNSTGVAINKVIINNCCSFIVAKYHFAVDNSLFERKYHCSFKVGSSLIAEGIRYSDAGKR